MCNMEAKINREKKKIETHTEIDPHNNTELETPNAVQRQRQPAAGQDIDKLFSFHRERVPKRREMAKANTIQTIRDYVSRMCTDVPGMKVLVMDTETTGIVSMVFTQTQVLQHEVFMTDTIERQRADKMPHLKAVYFVRPTADNVRRIQAELREPRFGEYHIFFSNMTRDGMIQQLAEADEHEVVQQVHYSSSILWHGAPFSWLRPEAVSRPQTRRTVSRLGGEMFMYVLARRCTSTTPTTCR